MSGAWVFKTNIQLYFVPANSPRDTWTNKDTNDLLMSTSQKASI
jgi:hypothetical protein